MKALYVKNDELMRSITQCNLRGTLYHFRNRNNLIGQGGFFEGALYSIFDMTELHWEYILAMPKKSIQLFDVLIINYKSGMIFEDIKKLTRDCFSKPKLLFISNANSDVMPQDQYLDCFDLIYKREPYKDLDRYKISTRNKQKIKPTMLSCPLVNIKKTNAKEYVPNISWDIKKNNLYDVTFVGKNTANVRYQICNKIADQKNINSYFSIFPSTVTNTINPKIKNKKLNLNNYCHMVNDTSVNLALEGFGQFTHRHLDLWYLGAFMLSSPSINDIQLPNGAHREGFHYAVYENEVDLIDKINYFIDNQDVRESIARNGYHFFHQIYNFSKHGESINNTIGSL